MPRAPRILDDSRCYPLDCRIAPHRDCPAAEELLYLGWTRLLAFARDLQYWAFLSEPQSRWLTSFFEQLDRCGLADEDDPGCSWPVAEAAAHLQAIHQLATDPPLELREHFDLWEGPLSIEADFSSLLGICQAHASCRATLTIRKWWHW